MNNSQQYLSRISWEPLQEWHKVAEFQVIVGRNVFPYTIDSDDRGDWRVMTTSLQGELIEVAHGRRDCQPYAELCSMTLA